MGRRADQFFVFEKKTRMCFFFCVSFMLWGKGRMGLLASIVASDALIGGTHVIEQTRQGEVGGC